VIPALVACALAWASVSQEGRVAAQDDIAITALVARYADARKAQDADKIESLFTADADQLVSSGEWRRGRGAVVRGTIASSRRTGGTRTLAVETIRMLTPDVAVADARYEIAGTAAGTRRMWSTFLLVKSASGWRIAAIRNMLPAAPVPPSGPR
jgi:uncharacterized protein (TIGR02246 family)